MKNIRIILDTRSVKKGGVSPVKVSIPHKGRTILLSTGIDVMPCQFKEGKIINTSNRNQLNAILRQRVNAVDNALLSIDQIKPLHHLSPNELKQSIERILTPEEEKRYTVSSVLEERIAKAQGNTKGLQEILRMHLLNFCKERKERYDRLMLDDVNRKWLQEFEAYLLKKVTRNSTSAYLSNFRAVFNHAINEELTKNYPFRGFRLKMERSKSRALSLEQLRTFINAGKTATENKYLQFFELSLLLLGMNVTDIWKAEPPKHGRVEYRRSKTGGRYSVKVGKRAKEILKHIGGTDHLTIASVMHSHTFKSTLNIYLANVSNRLEDFPKVTSYYARHTWATLAAEIGIPRHIIGAALGHAWTDVTGIYIGINEAQVDEASEAVEKYIYGE